MNNAAALLAAIREHPEEDTPRLEFADLIQEDGEDDRAELILLQCGRAMAERTGRCFVCGWTLAKEASQGCVPGNCSYRPEVATAEYMRIQPNREKLHRERELLLRHPEWRPVCRMCSGSKIHPSYGERDCPACGGTGRIGEYRRGWLHCVTVPRLVDVWERGPFESNPRRQWQPTPWALTLVREHPLLAEVVCEDRRPGIGNHFDKVAYVWTMGGWRGNHCTIPEVVFDELREWDHLGDGEKGWLTESAALSALAVAQVAALRKMCGVQVPQEPK